MRSRPTLGEAKNAAESLARWGILCPRKHARYVPQKDERKPAGDRPVYNLGMNEGNESQVGDPLCTTWGQQLCTMGKHLVRGCG